MSKTVAKKEIKQEIPNNKLYVIDAIVKSMEANHTCKWNDVGDELNVVLKTGGKLKILFPKTGGGKFTLHMDVKSKKVVDEIIEIEGQQIVEEDVKKSIFTSVPLSKITNNEYFNLGKNLKVFKEICKDFEKTGIEEVSFNSHKMTNYEDASMDKLTLVFRPPHINGPEANYPRSLKDVYAGIEGHKDIEFGGEAIIPIKGENTVPLIIGEHSIGTYYKDRNLLFIWFNPFKNVDLRSVKSYKENLYMKAILGDILTSFKTAKIGKTKNTQFKMMLLINSFNRSAKANLKNLQRNHKDTKSNIKSYESALGDYYEKIASLNNQIKALTVVEDDAIKLFLKEIEKTKKQPIVDNVELKDGHVQITFKPTTIKVEMDRSIDGTTKFGIKEMYLGKITVILSGNGKICVKNNLPQLSTKKPHPHATANGEPCLGSGSGAEGIRASIGERHFSKFVYLFWMWIKRWRPEDCYIPPHEFYDDRLQQGLPVFDHTGKAVKINDVKLIKSKEQIKLTPAKNYAKNIKDFAKYKSQA